MLTHSVLYLLTVAMPKVKRTKKRPPEGWELIEPTLDELEQKLREGELCQGALNRVFESFPCFVNTAEAETHEGKRRVEALWPIFK